MGSCHKVDLRLVRKEGTTSSALLIQGECPPNHITLTLLEAAIRAHPLQHLAMSLVNQPIIVHKSQVKIELCFCYAKISIPSALDHFNWLTQQ